MRPPIHKLYLHEPTGRYRLGLLDEGQSEEARRRGFSSPPDNRGSCENIPSQTWHRRDRLRPPKHGSRDAAGVALTRERDS